MADIRGVLIVTPWETRTVLSFYPCGLRRTGALWPLPSYQMHPYHQPLTPWLTVAGLDWGPGGGRVWEEGKDGNGRVKCGEAG